MGAAPRAKWLSRAVFLGLVVVVSLLTLGPSIMRSEKDKWEPRPMSSIGGYHQVGTIDPDKSYRPVRGWRRVWNKHANRETSRNPSRSAEVCNKQPK